MTEDELEELAGHALDRDEDEDSYHRYQEQEWLWDAR